MALNAIQDLATVDPFTQIYRNVRQMLLDDTVLGNQGTRIGLKPGNFPDLTNLATAKLVLKDSQNVADSPQVFVLSGTFTLKPWGSNSQIGEFVQSYPLVCSFADQNAAAPNLFKWRLMCAAMRAGTQLGLAGLVKAFELTDGTDDILGQQAIKQLQDRWCVFGGVRVHGYVSRSYLATA
jgi:hypothetical protein